MGKFFRKVRSTVRAASASIAKHENLAVSAMNLALAGVLAANLDWADEIHDKLEKLLRALEEDQFDTEDILHQELQKIFEDLLKSQDAPFFLKASLNAMLDTITQEVKEWLGGLDEDKVLSPEEKRIFRRMLETMLQTTKLAMQERERKRHK